MKILYNFHENRVKSVFFAKNVPSVFIQFLDTECLKIELAEERMREKTALEQKQQASKLIEILPEKTMLDQISDVEKHEFADKYAFFNLTFLPNH